MPTVIPAMDLIDEKLATGVLNTNFHVAIRAGMTMAKKTLNKYYEKSDLSEVYRIAMSM